jgi:hypothetical protein
MSTTPRPQAGRIQADLIEAGLALANLLAAENRLLELVDFAAAGALAPMKQQAVQRFAAAHQAGRNVSAAGAEANALSRLSERLGELACTNRLLLERALAAQARLIDCIAAAARPSGPGYAAPPTHDRPAAFALNARA